jgi:Tol biopolymer transport system component
VRRQPPRTVRQGWLAFSQHLRRIPREIWRTPGRKARPVERIPQKLIASSQDDLQAIYSPDGRRIVFQSGRSGSPNIWVADADGTNQAQSTSPRDPCRLGPLVPDSKNVVFDSRESGSADIYVVAAEGGEPRRLTLEPTDDINPSFSPDGRFVYFSSDRGGGREIWRLTAEGGSPVQVTHLGVYFGEECWDGHQLFFLCPRRS